MHKDDLSPITRFSRWRQGLQNIKRDEWLIGVVVVTLAGLPELIISRLFNLVDQLLSIPILLLKRLIGL